MTDDSRGRSNSGSSKESAKPSSLDGPPMDGHSGCTLQIPTARAKSMLESWNHPDGLPPKAKKTSSFFTDQQFKIAC